MPIQPLTVISLCLLLAGCSSPAETQKSRLADIGFYSGLAALESLAGNKGCTGCSSAIRAAGSSAERVYSEGAGNGSPTIIVVKK